MPLISCSDFHNCLFTSKMQLIIAFGNIYKILSLELMNSIAHYSFFSSEGTNIEN